MGIKENKYSKKPRSILLSTPQHQPNANYRGIADLGVSFGATTPAEKERR
jgi:hypothetical protein